ncbi:TPA: CPBP family intramembrane glutamic endopeptidase [Serratia fonticola]
MGSNYASYFSHNKSTAGILFCFVILSVAITSLPLLTVKFIGLEKSVIIVLVVEFFSALGLHFFLLHHYAQYKLTIELKREFIKKTLALLLLILTIQFSVFVYKINVYHSNIIKPDFMSIFAIVFIIPFYEEIFYRGCLFGTICSICKRNVIIPSVITSLLFCLMHTQYYSIPDQFVLFSLSLMLIYIRIETRSLSYPMLLHSGMNVFVVFLNAQEFYR